MPEFFTSRNGVLTLTTGEAFKQSPSKTTPTVTVKSVAVGSSAGSNTVTVSSVGATVGDLVIASVTSVYDAKNGNPIQLGTTGPTFTWSGYGGAGIPGAGNTAWVAYRVATGTESTYTFTGGILVTDALVTTLVVSGATSGVAQIDDGRASVTTESGPPRFHFGKINNFASSQVFAFDVAPFMVLMCHRYGLTTEPFIAPTGTTQQMSQRSGSFDVCVATTQLVTNGYSPTSWGSFGGSMTSDRPYTLMGVGVR